MNRTISYYKRVLSIVFAITTFSPNIFALTLASWNIEWLTINGDTRYPQSLREQNDFLLLRDTFEQMSPDVLAFQEVDSLEAIQAVVGGDYQIYLSDRAQPNNRALQFNGINQYTGFAIKKRYNVTDHKDLALTPDSRLRFATHVALNDGKQTIQLLSVHLKAGCAGKYSGSNRNCRQLKQQGRVLSDWLQQRVQAGEAYVMLGDFNHNLAFKGDWLWKDLVDGLTQQPTLTTRDTRADCKVRSRNNPNKTHQFRSLIDHILISPSLSASKAKQWVYPTKQVLNHQLSDHCPVYIELH
ncbi:endonuclease/exonuclease/phosphatase family protein [Vibrio hippocampi]|uniref:Endonuclease/exonuclease/phosphatase domain-containing protein n=1 Tax=Vibrio hippocampi TaxID=654686 RepID=A0ABM8ZM44_9VIBR|nr:endonuclease/exonuclease/phosphatase family protein [Vibrio hippocampi]CAH0529604.1 hypothetical protein VHP8226_03359 [Vibrio hippocampi]